MAWPLACRCNRRLPLLLLQPRLPSGRLLDRGGVARGVDDDSYLGGTAKPFSLPPLPLLSLPALPLLSSTPSSLMLLLLPVPVGSRRSCSSSSSMGSSGF
eukprot:GHVU01229933.1.p3 GENE.GHVU01229933.1~~GHVU01229933.1.p3  ORF type:complete len:100 (-),score=10.38 GHVU01229933.1:698-997(-)